MSTSLEFKVEEFVVEQISGAPGIPINMQISHRDRSAMAETERIAISATAGEQEQDGPQCYPVTVTVELKTISRDAEYLESVWKAIFDAIKPSGISYGIPYATGALDPLIYISEVGRDNRQDSKNTRTRTRTLTFKALEKN